MCKRDMGIDGRVVFWVVRPCGRAIGLSGLKLQAARASTSFGIMISVTLKIASGKGVHSALSEMVCGFEGIGAGLRIVTRPCFLPNSNANLESSILISSCTTRI